MSMFKCQIMIAHIEAHPDPEATAIELAHIGDYRSVVGKGLFKTGDRVVYLPEGAILPENMLIKMNLLGKLKGPEKNRIGAIKLRGCLSQGILYPALPEWAIGDDVSEILGVVKWEPVVPTSMSGEMQTCPNIKIRFDLENIKKHPNLIKPGDGVWFTEKLHGTCAVFGDIAEDKRHGEMFSGRYWISSKNAANGSLGPSAMFFKEVERNMNNAYVRVFQAMDMAEKLKALRERVGASLGKSVWILGEIFGGGIQDLKYGLSKPEFRVFAMKVEGAWLGLDEVSTHCHIIGLPMVPVLYRGPFSKELLEFHTNGNETISGGKHIREGLVVVPEVEQHSPDLDYGRIALKSISEAYLLRKNGTELT